MLLNKTGCRHHASPAVKKKTNLPRGVVANGCPELSHAHSKLAAVAKKLQGESLAATRTALRLLIISLIPLLLPACTPEPDLPVLPETTLPFFGAGYRSAGDPCRRLGESSDTIDYLDHTADLVGCPEQIDVLDAFETETGGRELFRQDGYVVYTVPL